MRPIKLESLPSSTRKKNEADEAEGEKYDDQDSVEEYDECMGGQAGGKSHAELL
jgi:hypothetical protein